MAVIFAGLALHSEANAQIAQGPQAPEHYTVDGNSIDVIRGSFNLSVTDLSIGTENAGMSYTRTKSGAVYRSNLDGLIEVEQAGEISPGQSQWAYNVSLGHQSQTYMTIYGDEEMASRGADGSTLSFDGLFYTHTDRDGTVRIFDPSLADFRGNGAAQPPAGPGGRIIRLIKPTGERWDWYYRSASWGSPASTRRIQSVTSTRGYQLKFEYSFNGTPSSFSELELFGRLSRAIGVNTGIDYCDPAADRCPNISVTWPSATYNVSVSDGSTRLDVTNALNKTTGYVFEGAGIGGDITEIDWPEPGRASTTLAYGNFPFGGDSNRRVIQYSDGRGTWTYGYTLFGSGQGQLNTVVTDPNNLQSTYRSRLRYVLPWGEIIENQRLLWLENSLGQRTYTQYDGNGRLERVTRPEGDIDFMVHDARGNVAETRRTAKPSLSATDIVSTAAFPSTCDNRITCNQPTSRTDARGGITEYVYDPVHGGLLTETGPAPVAGAPRPQTRYTWEQRYAWYKQNGSSAITRAPSPVWVQTGSSSCMTGSTC